MLDCISAIATPNGVGGVAVIRVSGDGALSIAEKMFKPAGRTKVSDFSPNAVYAGEILAEGFTDFGLCLFFKAPRSFTGEDVVEFQCHGGVGIARGVLSKTISLGARLAERGEFTRRAFLNGKLTLASAEGMIDMINADSLAAIRAGSMLYAGKINSEVAQIQASLKDILAAISAMIDYPEEYDGDTGIEKSVAAAYERLKKFVATYPAGRIIKEGVTVAICGKPNAGKSSLLNALIGYDKAIVSDEAGTTRDAVEGELMLGGVKFTLYDTAGIRQTYNKVEGIGIDRAKAIISSADIVISVDDGGGEAALPADLTAEVIRVFNKCDLNCPQSKYDVVLSALTGEGVEELISRLERYIPSAVLTDGAYLCDKRHFEAASRALASLESALETCKNYGAEVTAVDLTDAWSALGEITGETASEDIIDAVFEKFCVGK